MSPFWLAAVPAFCSCAALLWRLRAMRREMGTLRDQLAIVTQQGTAVALELQKHLQKAGSIPLSRTSGGHAARRVGDVVGVEEREELLAEIRLLLDELGTEAARMQSLKIERHELIALLDRAEELLTRASEALTR